MSNYAEDAVQFISFMESLFFGLMAYLFLTDMTIGQNNIARELLLEFGYPRWMVPIIGILQLGIAISNFHDGGSWRFVGQKVLAVLMGGCIFSHAVQSRAIKNAASPACFLICSMLMPILAGKEPWQVVVPLHIALAGLGYTVGEVLRMSKIAAAVPYRQVMLEESRQRHAAAAQAGGGGGGGGGAAPEEAEAVQPKQDNTEKENKDKENKKNK